MAPREGNDVVKHGVLDERLNVHGVKNLKVSDLSICPDNVGCNTFSVRPFPRLYGDLGANGVNRLPCLLARSVQSCRQRIWAIAVMRLRCGFRLTMLLVRRQDSVVSNSSYPSMCSDGGIAMTSHSFPQSHHSHLLATRRA
jgi:hypothetical protein